MTVSRRPNPNPYLAGNFAPIPDETTVFDLPVKGALPKELDGRLLRNGPNPIAVGDPLNHHWFVGTGMVHGLRMRDGNAEWYRSRYVMDDTVAESLGRPGVTGPRHGMGSGTANTNVISHAGRTFAIVEAGSVPVELNDELETIGRVDFEGTLPGSYTAHPKRDPATGELHAVVYYWEWDYIQYVVLDENCRVRRSVNVPVPGKPMVHDCAISETRVVLLDLPCVFDLDTAMQGIGLPYTWKPEEGARVGVLPFDGEASDVRWCELDDPCYVYHPLNAVDQPDGSMLLDVVVHPRMFDTDRLGPNEGPTTFERWTLDVTGAKVRRDVLSDRAQEFPRHREDLVGRPVRYGYAADFSYLGGPEKGLGLGALLKHDLDRATMEVHDPGPGRNAMEGVFVSREGGQAEDDGWLLSYVYDANRDATDVIVLAADDFTAPPVATVQLPVRVPYGFHGNWCPTA